MSSRYTKKRKHDLDLDTSGGGGGSSRDHDEASPKKSSRRHKRESSGSPPRQGGAKEDSLSIEETNKLRISLGLAPLEVDDGPKVKETESAEGNVIIEDGMEFVHKAAESLTKKKETDKIKSKIDVQAQKRKIQSKLLKAKGLADTDSEDEGVESWIEKNRQLEEEKKKALQKAKELDAFEDELVQNIPKKTVKKARSKLNPEDALAGMTVGHSKSAFMTGEETILVLDDKDVLDDNGEEVLVNPTLMYNEQLKRNKETRNKKSDYNPYDDEEIDEFGVVKKKNLLAKYDEEIEGPATRESFKLDAKGQLDLTREEEEERIKRGLFMANRQLQSLETPKYTIAAEFYTNEEMVSFRKPKKKKDGSKSRKRKGNKEDISSTLQPEEETEAERKARERKLRARRGEDENDEPKKEKTEDGHEEGEIVEPVHSELPKQRFRDTMGGSVDSIKMRSLLDKLKKEQTHDEDEEDFEERNDLAGVIIDDDVEDELSSALEKARKLKIIEQAQKEQEDSAVRTRKKFESLRNVKLEVDEKMETEADDSGPKRIVFDATAEFYKTVGDLPTYGLAGNRDDDVDYSEILAEQANQKAEKVKSEVEEEEIEIVSKKKEKKDKRERHSTRHEKEKQKHFKREVSPEDEKMDVDEEKEKEYVNVLGKEKDVTKGVAGMLKLASEKGYLEDPNAKKNKGGTLKHLESQNFAKVEFTRYDIEDKYLKKMERLGTTGSGPRRAFPEKKDYNPQVEITYSDPQGKEMDPKAAFRSLSHKFHGKQPGKKQVEKRMRQQDKKERLKKMNSSDTPLGTLEKQRKKLEQLQTPYLVLSGSNRETGVSLQKD